MHVGKYIEWDVFRNESYFSLANCENESLRQNENQVNGYCIARKNVILVYVDIGGYYMS